MTIVSVEAVVNIKASWRLDIDGKMTVDELRQTIARDPRLVQSLKDDGLVTEATVTAVNYLLVEEEGATTIINDPGGVPAVPRPVGPKK